MKISEILAQYDTDKVNGHCYGEFYDDLFSKYDRKDALDILEIGTQKGGSLSAWQDYFPNATITGIDIVDVVKPEYIRGGIDYIISDIKQWKSDKTYDIVIDDGSHFLEDVLYVVNNIKFKTLVIEDVQAPDTWVMEISKIKPVQVVDLRGVNGNYDDFIIVCNS